MSKEKKSDTLKATEIIDRIDCISKNMASLRADIAAIVRDAVSQEFKERNKYVEVGYR